MCWLTLSPVLSRLFCATRILFTEISSLYRRAARSNRRNSLAEFIGVVRWLISLLNWGISKGLCCIKRVPPSITANYSLPQNPCLFKHMFASLVKTKIANNIRNRSRRYAQLPFKGIKLQSNWWTNLLSLVQFTCRALNGLLLLALIISDLNKALYSSSLIGVICKLSIPISECCPRGAAGLQHFPTWVTIVVQVRMREQACKVCRRGSPWTCTRNPCDTYVEQCPVCEMRQAQMDPRSAGFSRATPSFHMLNPSCYLSICLLFSSTLLTWLECLMEPQWSSSSVPWLSATKKKSNKKTADQFGSCTGT